MALDWTNPDPLDHAYWREVCAAAAERVSATGESVPSILFRCGSCSLPSADGLSTIVDSLLDVCDDYYNLPLSAEIQRFYANSSGRTGTIGRSADLGYQYPDDTGSTYSMTRSVRGRAGILPGLPIPVVPLPGTPLRHPLMRQLLVALHGLLQAMAYLRVSSSSDEKRPMGYGWARKNGEFTETHEYNCDGEEEQFVRYGDRGHTAMRGIQIPTEKFASVSGMVSAIADSMGDGCVFPYGWSSVQGFFDMAFFGVAHWGFEYTVRTSFPVAYERTAEPLPKWYWFGDYGFIHEKVGLEENLSHVLRPGWNSIAGDFDPRTASHGASVTPVYPSDLYVYACKSRPTYATANWVPDAQPVWDDARECIKWPDYDDADYPSGYCQKYVFSDCGLGLRIGWNRVASGVGRIEWPTRIPVPGLPSGYQDRKCADAQIYFGESAYRQWTSQPNGVISVSHESDTTIHVGCSIFAMALKPEFRHITVPAPNLEPGPESSGD